jgi:polyhydroxyalkanoate synthesis regulator protein
METIKKYKNRKLYSKTQSKYVDVKYLINKLQKKEAFTVVDATNNVDITSKVLKQALTQASLTDDAVRKILTGE